LLSKGKGKVDPVLN